jgi:hypothetical protein
MIFASKEQEKINEWLTELSTDSAWRSEDIPDLRAAINQQAVIAGEEASPALLQLQSYLNGAESNAREMFAQGATFNLADEIKSIGTRYPRDFYLAVENDAMRVYKQQKPIKSAASQIGGAFIPTAVTVAANVAGRKIPKMPAPKIYVDPRMQKGIDFVTAATRKFASKFNPFQKGIAKSGVYGTTYAIGADEGSATERVTKLKPYVTGLIAAGLSIPSRFITGKIFNAIADRVSKYPSAERGEEIAYEMLAEALENDAGSVEEALVMAANAMNKGRDLTVADTSRSTADLLDMVNMIPSRLTSQTREFLEQRQQGRFQRIQSDLVKAFGPDASYYETIKLLQEARSADSAPLYEAAMVDPETGEDRFVTLGDEYLVNVGGKEDPITLNTLLSRPVMKDAYARASRIAANQGIVLPNVEFTEDGLVILEGDNKGQSIDALNFEFLHFMKQGLDDLISNANSPVKTSTSVGRTELAGYMQNKNIFLQILDSNPEYAAARKIFAGHMATADALEMGKNVFNKSYTKNIDLHEMVANYGPSEKEAFTNGVYHGLDEKLMDTSEKQNFAGRLLYTPRVRSLIKLAFDGSEEEFNQFMDNMVTEADARAVENRVLMGSQTAGRTQMSDKYKAKTDRAIFATDLNTFDKVVRFAINADFDKLNEQQDKAFADEIKKILTETEIGRLEQELKRGFSLGEAWVRAGAAPKFVAFFKALSDLDGSPYVLGDVANQATDFAESAQIIDFDKYDKKIKENFYKLMEQNLETSSVDNARRSMPDSIADQILPKEKENIASQLDTMLADIKPSNIPLVPPATAVTPDSMLSETILPNPKDREIAERLMANKGGIGSLA